MAIVVEDGTGKTDAVAYVDVAFVDAYVTTRGGDATWDGAAAGDKEAAIVAATDYLDRRFGHRFVGAKATKAQALEWPRNDAKDRAGFDYSYDDETDSGEIPEPLKRASAEYARRAASSTLAPDPGQSAAAGPVKSRREKVGPVETDVSYAGAGSAGSVGGVTSSTDLQAYPMADLALTPILRPRSGRVIRN